MGKAPAFQFYANDFMDATRFWEANACGLFIRCLCIQWTQGGLPTDLRMLSKGVGMDFEEFEQAWKMVVSKFDLCEDGLLRNSRLEAVRSRQEEISSKRSNAGIAGVFAKANASANGQAKSKQRKEKKKEKIEEEVGRVVTTSKTLFSQCRYTNIELVREALPELVAEGVNLEHYLDAISNWSDTKDERRSDRGWLATFRQWAKTDRDKGELKKAGAPTNGKPAWNPRG